jgi:outer membrane protein OmpA-like peptidoglycan-associated protein
MRRVAALCLPLLLAFNSASAQGRPGLEVGGFLRWDFFDASLRMDDYFATGARAGISVLPFLALEGDISRSSTNGPPGTAVTSSSFHVRAIHDRRIGHRVAGLVGIGFVHNDYGASRSGSENGISGMVGARVPISDLIAVRLDLTADYLPSPANTSATVRHNWNYGIAQGLSLTMGGRRAETTWSPPPPAPATVSTAATPALPQPPPADSDHDGVPDASDRCPNTSTGAVVDAFGCTLDSDGDRVPDFSDRCPNTPAGATVNASGCPLDSDGDGVLDGLDVCPDTPANTKVDARGCLVLFEPNRRSLVLQDVHFAHGKAEILPDSRSILNAVAASLRANPDVRVMVEGHTSSVGTRDVNLQLSLARANAVRDYLTGRGIAADRLEADGFGPDRPVASNATEEGQAKNRRVELRELKS